MGTLFSFLLDIALIGLLLAAIVYAIRLSHQLTGLRQSRAEMERFILDFNATVLRAEAGVRGLKQAARNGGDDLEKLIDRGTILRDELSYLIDSADQVAARLTDAATKTSSARPKTESAESVKPRNENKVEEIKPPPQQQPSPTSLAASGAERELLRVLGKLK